MPDTKITALTALTAADPANDVLPIVDVSDTTMAASGTTKKISVNNILGCSGTATLASATITGNLTAGGNVNLPANVSLKAGPSAAVQAGLKFDASNNTYLDSDIGLVFRTGAATSFTTAYQIGATGISTWSVAGTTAMTLNSTGLGVGVSPSYQIHARKDQAAFTTIAIDNQNAIAAGTGAQFLLIDGGVNAGWFRRTRDGLGNTDIGYKDTLRFRGAIAGTERTDMLIDSSGNVGVGVTPITGHRISSVGPIGLSGGPNSFLAVGNYCSIYYTDGSGSSFPFLEYGNLVIHPRDARNVVIATAPSAGSNTSRIVVKTNGQVRFVPLAADPSGAEAGDVYYNSVSNRLKYYNGTAWTLI